MTDTTEAEERTNASDLGATLRMMYGTMHNWLEGTLHDVTPDQAHWQPSGRVVPAGAHYAHHVIGAEDMMLNMMIRGGTPLAMGEWAGRTGSSEMLPMGPWAEWARSTQIDLPALREYAHAVYDTMDA
jgi:hypothetical protein